MLILFIYDFKKKYFKIIRVHILNFLTILLKEILKYREREIQTEKGGDGANVFV